MQSPTNWITSPFSLIIPRLTRNCLSCTLSQSLKRHEHLIVCSSFLSVYLSCRNDHTKIDLDNARLIPTADLSRVSFLDGNDVQKDEVTYSIGEIEIMVYDNNELQTSHSEVWLFCIYSDQRVENEMKQVRASLGVETSTKLLSKLDRYFLEYLPDFYKNYPYHTW